MDNCNVVKLSSELENSIKNIVKEEAINNYKVNLESASLKGDGYLGTITSLKLEGKDKSGKPKILNCVLKSAPQSMQLRSAIPIRRCYEQEICMYETVFPSFRQLEIEKGILKPFTSTAKCYGSSLVDENEYLILENLKEVHYNLWDKRVPMDHNHLEMVFSKYGRYHALSFAVRDQKPELFTKLIKNFTSILTEVLQSAGFIDTIPILCKKVMKTFDPATEANIIESLNEFIDTFLENMQNVAKNPDKYSVISHGDCWCNNFMFKYSDSSNPKKPTDVCIIDWQLVRQAPPVLDLLYFFYCSCSKEALFNFRHYQNVYYDSLSSYLKQLGSEADKVYPFSVFEAQWKKHAGFGLAMAILVIHTTLGDEAETKDLSELFDSGEQIGMAFASDIAKQDVYLQRIKEIVVHLSKNNFI